jgi:asparagine synthase (glutamine-hydrolysing)
LRGIKASVQDTSGFKIRITTRHQPIRNSHKGCFWGGTYAQSLSQFRENFSASVEERLLSDVELGVYLSGGIDSKAVAFELAQALTKRNRTWQRSALKSFTVGFESAGYDETDEAVAFARSLHFEPHVLTLSNAALNYSYPHAVHISENLQPYTNGSAKWWLSLFARQSVLGVLTGDGADELLCGYPSFRYCAWWAFSQRNRPQGVPLGQRWRDSVYTRKFMNQSRDPWLAGSSAEGRGDDFTASLALWGVPHPLFGQILAITESILGAAEARIWLAAQGPSVRSWFLHGLEPASKNDAAFPLNPENALLLWQNYFCLTHLPVQVLNWVGDRMEMANTLEGRTPFLSGRMRRFLFSLPDVALVQGFTDKAVLRKAYASQFPRHFALTPKKQFNAPFVQSSALFRSFDTDGILNRMGISASKAGVEHALLRESEAGPSEHLSAGERYLRAHRLSALQTLICSAIVDRSLVEENPPQRDHEFENHIIRTGGPLS